jgi:t-SNARE complex subunit (syntaxin)
MTDEERQRQMDFIINTLANITATQERSELERQADAVRIGRLEDSMVTLTQVSETLTQLVQKSDERLDEHQEQITDVREAIVILTKLVDEGRNGQA